MNGQRFLVALAILTLGGACEAPPEGDWGASAEVRRGPAPEVDPNRRVVAPEAGPGRAALATLTNQSGLVTTTIWECTSSSNQSIQAVQCSVDSDYVVVGGGARTVYSGAGAMLTASFPPDSDLTRWEARSKDHLVEDFHQLKVYAIGLKLRGVSRAKLRSNILVNTFTSHPAHHPSASASEFGFSILELGGGSRANWEGAGSLLHASYGEVAQSKDHEFDDFASITHWRMGIRDPISDFGHLETRRIASTVSVDGGLATTSRDVTNGWVPVSIGAATSGGPSGRLLTAMSPSTGDTATTFIAQSKDHLVPDGGPLLLIVGEMKKRF